MKASFLIPAEPLSIEIEVRKSRFICHLAHAPNADQARKFIVEITKQNADATHNCWAFQTEEPGSTLSIGCSDDGEPHGTAGKPMLNILCHANIGEIVAVVTRYYGGTKLGTGGLARAYSDSVKAGLDLVKTCEKVDWKFAYIILEYSLQSQVEKMFQDQGAEIISTQFEENIRYKIRYNEETLDIINTNLSNVSQGRLKLLPVLSD